MRLSSTQVDDPFFERVAADVADGVISLDSSGTVVFSNPAAADLLGYEPGHLLDRPVDRLLPTGEGRPIETIRSLATAESATELALRHRTGRAVPTAIVVEASRYDGDRFFTLTLRDVSGQRERKANADRRERESKLQEAGTVLELIFEHTTDGIAVFDPEAGEITECNPRLCELLGYSREELLALDPATLYRHQPSRWERVLARVLEEGVARTDELAPLTRDGDEVPVALSASRLEIDGRPHVLVNLRNLTERRAHRERLLALNRASHRLLLAGTERAVAEIAVELVGTVLDRSLTTLWTADGDCLRALAASDRIHALAETIPTALEPIPQDTVEMATYERGEPRLLEGYGTIENAAHPELPLETRLLVPIGEYGLLGVGSTTDDVDPPLRDLVGVLGATIQAAFEALEAGRRTDQRSAAMDAATDGMAILDDERTLRYVNDAFATIHGYDDPGELLGTDWGRLYDDGEVAGLDSAIPAPEDGWRGEATGIRADGSTFPQELSLATLPDGGLVCVVRDVTETKAQERQLEALNAVSAELMDATTRETIARVGVAAVEEVLGFEVACLRLFDGDRGRLGELATTDGAGRLLDSRPAYDLEASLAGSAFRAGETLTNVVETDEASVFEESSFHVPVGSEGVLTVVAEEGFGHRDVHLAEMLATALETAIGRADRSRLLRENERELSRRRDELETMVRINSLFQQTGQRLIEATTREELERGICETLARSEHYRSAWICDVGVTGERIVPRTGTGVEEGYLAAVEELPLGDVAGGAVERAIETGEVQVVRQYRFAGVDGHDPETEGSLPGVDGHDPETEGSLPGVDDHDPETNGIVAGGDRHVADVDDHASDVDDHAPDADEYVPDVEATAAVPILHGDNLTGVLVVNAVSGDAFGPGSVEGFGSFGRVVGFATEAIRNRELLLSDSVVELEFTMSDPSTFYSQVTADLDCRLRFERSVQLEEGRVINYHTVEGVEPEPLLEAAEGYEDVEEPRVVAEREESFVLQTVTARSTVQLGLEMGATIRSAEATDGVGTITFEAPRTANVREIVDAVDDAFATVEFVAKREHDRSVKTAGEFRDAVADGLTDKQRAAIESAFFAGYYDWPREITAEELADSMGISSSTLHQHLRKGTWSVFSAFFEE